MKKYIIIFIALFILTGCTNIKDLTYDEVINKTLNQKEVKKNTYLEGYKLYLPENVTMIGDLNGNDILYSGGDKYYLYVDLISYYNKKQNIYNLENKNYTYSKNFDYNKLNGYVTISKSKGGFLVEIMYNYAKIEVVTKDVKNAIANSLIVLKNIDYNYKIIDSMIGSNALVYDAETFTLLGPKTKEDNFLSYVEEYGVYNEKDSPEDEDIIEMESAD